MEDRWVPATSTRCEEHTHETRLATSATCWNHYGTHHAALVLVACAPQAGSTAYQRVLAKRFHSKAWSLPVHCPGSASTWKGQVEAARISLRLRAVLQVQQSRLDACACPSCIARSSTAVYNYRIVMGRMQMMQIALSQCHYVSVKSPITHLHLGRALRFRHPRHTIDWTIHELAVVAFPDATDRGALETAMIRHLRAMPEGMLLLNNNQSHHENDQRQRRRADYMRDWRVAHGQGTPDSYMAAAGRRHRPAARAQGGIGSRGGGGRAHGARGAGGGGGACMRIYSNIYHYMRRYRTCSHADTHARTHAQTAVTAPGRPVGASLANNEANMGKNHWPVSQQAYCCLPLDVGILYSVVALVCMPSRAQTISRFHAQSDCSLSTVYSAALR